MNVKNLWGRGNKTHEAMTHHSIKFPLYHEMGGSLTKEDEQRRDLDLAMYAPGTTPPNMFPWLLIPRENKKGFGSRSDLVHGYGKFF